MRPKPLSKEDIIRAQKSTLSNRAASRYLHCSYQHYKKYAKLFTDENGANLFDRHKNQSGKGIPKFLSGNVDRTEPSILDIIEGRVSVDHFTPEKIKLRLLSEGYLEEKCYKCDFHERRVIDYKIPLLLNFKDGNKKNYSIDNTELLCYNCYFLWVGDIFSSKQIQGIEDYVIPTSTYETTWELDDHYTEHFKKLGLIDDSKDGEEFISKK